MLNLVAIVFADVLVNFKLQKNTAVSNFHAMSIRKRNIVLLWGHQMLFAPPCNGSRTIQIS